MKTILEKYYNERFKQKGDPNFKEFSEDNKRSLKKSFGFAIYEFETAFNKFVLAWNDCGKALRNAGF